MRFSELPSDLDDQLPTAGPPPSWFPVTGVITTTIDPSRYNWYSPQFNGMDARSSIVATSIDPFRAAQFYGLGDREEGEVNPSEIIGDLKANQQMPRNIPLIANRYTTIDPESPMFRADRPKYGYGGYGDFTPDDTKNLIKLAAAAALIYYFLLRKK